MSQENVEMVRGLAEAFQRRDHEPAFEFYDDEIEWDLTSEAVAPDMAGAYRGHDGTRNLWRRWLSEWKDLEFEIQDVRDGGDDIVLLIRNQLSYRPGSFDYRGRRPDAYSQKGTPAGWSRPAIPEH